MKLIEYIHRKQREKTLARMAAVAHPKRLPALDDVRSIGIVLDNQLTEEEQYTLKLFNEHMNKRDIVVGLYRLPANDDKENRSRNGFPTLTHLSTFTSHTYDLLIAATSVVDDSTLFAVLNTPAHLRVAYDNTELLPYPLATATFDLFIRGKGTCTMTSYLREILMILTNIKKQHQ